MELNWLDIVAGSLILIIGLKGLFSGFVKELAGLLGLIAGVWIASMFASSFGAWMGENFISIESKSALSMIGFLTLLALIWLSFIIIGALVAKLISLSGLGVMDKVLGFIFASAKVFTIIAVIVYALSNIEIVKNSTTKFTSNSILYPLFLKAGDKVVNFDTGALKSGVESIKEDTKKKLEGIISDNNDSL